MVVSGVVTVEEKARPLSLFKRALTQITLTTSRNNVDIVYIGNVTVNYEGSQRYAMDIDRTITLRNVAPAEVWVVGEKKGDTVSWIGS